MNRKQVFAFAAAAIVLTLAGATGGYWIATRPNPQTVETKPDTNAMGQGKAMYWYDPMVPAQHFDKPGKSPFMDMQLVPKYADESSVGNGVRIDPLLTQNTGMKFATVENGLLAQGVEAVGSVVFNERLVAVVQARSGGLVERVYARAPNDVIAAGAALADIRVPEWYGAQAEFLVLKKTGDMVLAAAARSRLQQLGMSAAQIARMEKSGVPLAVVTISAPFSGMLQEIGVREGMVITPGQTLAKINGISSVWLEAEVPEAQAGRLVVGTRVSATFNAWPDKKLEGKVAALLPELNREAHTLRVRVELPNPDGKLRPGMYARVKISEPDQRIVLLVPSEAVIATGKRSLVIVADEASHFRPAEVKTGRESGGKTEILDGLKEGQKIVVSGQFMIDSEASLNGVLARMESSAKPAAMQSHQAQGKLEALAADEVTISHGPVPSIGWGPMTMPFNLADPKQAQGLKVGDTVKFAFHEDEAGMVIDQMEKTGGGR